jgi:hypothetical protein
MDTKETKRTTAAQADMSDVSSSNSVSPKNDQAIEKRRSIVAPSVKKLEVNIQTVLKPAINGTNAQSKADLLPPDET